MRNLTNYIIILLLALSTTMCTEKSDKVKETAQKVTLKSKSYTNQHIIREAHRGASLEFPENTLISFKEAIKKGTDRLELDVNMTSDNVLIIMHDKTLDRTTNGKGVVLETSFETIKKLDAGSWKNAKFKDEKVPTLKEVFELAKGKVLLNLDLKDESVAIPMAKLAREMGMIDDIVITGTIPQSVTAIRSVEPTISMFYELITEDVLKNPKEQVLAIRKAHLSGCLLNFKGVNDIFMKECKKHGIAVYVYDVLKEEDMKKMIEAGVDGMMTDNLEVLNKVLGK